MKNRTLFIVFLLFLGMGGISACKSTDGLSSDAEIQKQLNKDKKKKGRAAKKANKEAYKHFWSLQSKETKKSIKKNNRYQKRKARKLKK